MMNDFYTYAYLRTDRTPYYIGKGKYKKISTHLNKYFRAYYGKHYVPIPPKERVLILKFDITEEKSLNHERYMIGILGRKDLGTGILRNLTDGGEGTSGFKHSDEYKKNVSTRTKNWICLNGNPNLKTYLLINVDGKEYVVNDGLKPFCKKKNIPFDGMQRRKNRGFDTPTKCGWVYFNITNKTEEEIQNIKKQFFLKYQNRFNDKLKNLEIPSDGKTIAQKSINITFNLIEEKIKNEYDRLINYNGKKYIKISEEEFKQHKISSKTAYRAIKILKENGIISVEQLNKRNFDQSNYYSLCS
jgi:hypothetical protein